MVYYIYHSAFVIELEKSILIFDFYKFPNNKKKEKEQFFRGKLVLLSLFLFLLISWKK